MSQCRSELSYRSASVRHTEVRSEKWAAKIPWKIARFRHISQKSALSVDFGHISVYLRNLSQKSVVSFAKCAAKMLGKFSTLFLISQKLGL